MGDSVVELLEAMRADYQIVECAPELADTAQFCEHYGYRLDESANAILVVGKGEPRLYALCVVLAHLGGATIWVFSTVRLQQTLPEKIRGRVFALEYAIWTAMFVQFAPVGGAVWVVGNGSESVQ